MRTGRVRVQVPDGLDLAPDVADMVAEFTARAAIVARDPTVTDAQSAVVSENDQA